MNKTSFLVFFIDHCSKTKRLFQSKDNDQRHVKTTRLATLKTCQNLSKHTSIIIDTSINCNKKVKIRFFSNFVLFSITKKEIRLFTGYTSEKHDISINSVCIA